MKLKIPNFNILLYTGTILVVLFIIMGISGIYLAMYYKPDFNLAFESVNTVIMHEAPYGWMWRKIHGVGSTFFFLVLYIHLFGMIYLGFYKHTKRFFWITGMLLYFGFMVVGFTGYVLPMGQMSYWAAQVITSLLAYIPGFGEDAMRLVRGDYALSDVTLMRFYVLHIALMPVVLIAIVLFHSDFFKWFATHKFSFNRKGLHVNKQMRYFKTKEPHCEPKPFFSNNVLKPLLATTLFLALFFYAVFFHDYLAFDALNFTPADPENTPAHIYPEWYFLWMLQLLKSFFIDIGPISSGYIGMASLVVVNLGLVFLPYLDKNPKRLKANERAYFKWWFLTLLICFIALTILGKFPGTSLVLWLGMVFSIILMGLFFILPWLSKKEVHGKS